MAKRSKRKAEDFFAKGTEFFKSFNESINLAQELVKLIKDNNSNNNNTNEGKKYHGSKEEHDKENEVKIKEAAYRFMKLKPGCGMEKVKQKFREMVKEKRPDISTDDEKTRWFMALKTSKETLLKYEK